jgi:hypothetical protein
MNYYSLQIEMGFKTKTKKSIHPPICVHGVALSNWAQEKVYPFLVPLVYAAYQHSTILVKIILLDQLREVKQLRENAKNLSN